MQVENKGLDRNKLSVIMAVIVMAFSMTRILSYNSPTIQINIGGFLIDLNFGFDTLVAIFTGLLSAAGINWMIMSHPHVITQNLKWYTVVSHWIIPVFSSFVISITLHGMEKGNSWWVVLGLGSLLLLLVFVAEYRVVETSTMKNPLAAISLTALSFALLLILLIALKTATVRLYLLVPISIAAGVLLALRTLYLRTGGRWMIEWAGLIGLITVQSVIGLNYLPLKPIPFAMFVIAILYSLTSLCIGLIEKKERFTLYGEPLIMFCVICLTGVILSL